MIKKNSYYITRKLKHKNKLGVFGFNCKFVVKGKHLIVPISEKEIRENKSRE